jgi:hypothetical protein
MKLLYTPYLLFVPFVAASLATALTSLAPPDPAVASAKTCRLAQFTYASFRNNQAVKTTEQYNYKAGRLTAVNILTNGVEDKKYFTSLTYDSLDRLQTVTAEPYQMVSTYTYNAKGELE